MPTQGKAKYPFGPADVKVMTAADTAQTFAIDNALTIIDGVTNEATANRTINLTIDTDSVKVGDRIVVQSQTAATQTTIFGTGITGITITGVAGTIITKSFTFDGSAFLADGEQVN
jgi:hypothetical protein